jgi:peptidoglycan-associated lipoprotein
MTLAEETMKAFLLCTLLASCPVGCASQAPTTPPVLTSATTDDFVRAVDWPDLGRGEARFIRIDLGPDTFAECHRVSPKFPFDSATTFAVDRAQLAALASCLNHASMRDRTVLLVGRADPRGENAYNLELGRKRAIAIRQLLLDNGLQDSRIELTTEGASGAVGNQPDYSYGYDRRVDVVVKGGAHAP